jgi:hypothetical protein
VHFGDVGGGLERQPGTEDQVADQLLADDGDEDVVGAEAGEEGALGVGWRAGAYPRRPGRSVEPAQGPLVGLVGAADQENFCGSSRQ